jgi:hypothetical protein
MSTSPLDGTVSSPYGTVHYLRGVSAQSLLGAGGVGMATGKRVTVSGP